MFPRFKCPNMFQIVKQFIPWLLPYNLICRSVVNGHLLLVIINDTFISPITEDILNIAFAIPKRSLKNCTTKIMYENKLIW